MPPEELNRWPHKKRISMCVVFCHRRLILYDNHADCDADICPFVGQILGFCRTCQHRQGRVCTLTNSSLPDEGYCCHYNVPFIETEVAVTTVMVTPLPMVGFFDQAGNVLPAQIPRRQDGNKGLVPAGCAQTLDDLGIKYQQNGDDLLVDLDQPVLAIYEPIPDILDRFDIPYYHRGQTCYLDPAQSSLPGTFGRGAAVCSPENARN
jgi:hypothetical protein